MELKKIKDGLPVVEVQPHTHEQWLGEYDFITLERFLRKLLNEGKIKEEELSKIRKKIRDKFSPFYPEIRA